jgi:polyhydroxyalkanoate synthesis regulator phasin
MEYVLKRYSNRRLYDPQRGENVTLDGVVELVRQNRRVRIVDNRTGDDLTVRVLSQAFLSSLKDWKNERRALEVLRVLVAEGGESSVDILKKTMLASLGAFEVTRQKAEEIIDTLIQKGEIAKSQRSDAVVELLDKAQESTRKFKDKIAEDVTNAVEKLKVARKTDLEALEAKVDKLIETVNKLQEKLTS